MSMAETAKGVLKTFFAMSKEEFDVMDHKLFRIGAGIIGFVAVTTFWFFLYRTMGVF